MQPAVHRCRQPMPAGTGIPITRPVFAGEFCMKDTMGSKVAGCTGRPPSCTRDIAGAASVLHTETVSICLAPSCTAQTMVGTRPVPRALQAVQQQNTAGNPVAPRRQHSPARELLHVPAHLQQAAESAPPRPLVLAQDPDLHGTRLVAGTSPRAPETAGSSAPPLLRAPTAARRQAGWQDTPSSSREGWQPS